MRRVGRRIPARDPVTGLFVKGRKNPRKAKAAAAPAKPRKRKPAKAKASVGAPWSPVMATVAAPAKPRRRRRKRSGGTVAVRKARRAVRKSAPKRKVAPKRRKASAKSTMARRFNKMLTKTKKAAPKRTRRKAVTRKRPPRGWVFYKNPAKRRRSPKRWHVRGHWSHRRNPSVMQWVKSIVTTIGGYAAATALANFAANHIAKHAAANQGSGTWQFLGRHGRPLVGAALLAGTVYATRKVRKLAPLETPLVLGAGVALFNELISAYLPPDSKMLPYVAQLPAPNPSLGAIDVYEAALAELQNPQLRGYVQDGMGADLESDEGITASDEWYDLEGNMGSYVEEPLSAYVEEPLGAYVEEPMSGYVDGGEDFGSYVEEPLSGGIFGEDQDKEGGSSLEGSELYEALGAQEFAVIPTRETPPPPTRQAKAVRQPARRTGRAVRHLPPMPRPTVVGGVVVKPTTRQGEAPARAVRDVSGATGLVAAIKPAQPEAVYQDGSLYAGQVGGIFRRSMFEGN